MHHGPLLVDEQIKNDWQLTCQVQKWLQNCLRQIHSDQPVPLPETSQLESILERIAQYAQRVEAGAGYLQRRWFRWRYQIKHTLDCLHQWRLIYGLQGQIQLATKIQQAIAAYQRVTSQEVQPLQEVPSEQAIACWRWWSNAYRLQTEDSNAQNIKLWFTHQLKQADRAANFKRQPSLEDRIHIRNGLEIIFYLGKLRRPLSLDQVMKNVMAYQRLSWLGRFIKRCTRNHIKQQQQLLTYYQDRWIAAMNRQQEDIPRQDEQRTRSLEQASGALHSQPIIDLSIQKRRVMELLAQLESLAIEVRSPVIENLEQGLMRVYNFNKNSQVDQRALDLWIQMLLELTDKTLEVKPIDEKASIADRISTPPLPVKQPSPSSLLPIRARQQTMLVTSRIFSGDWQALQDILPQWHADIVLGWQALFQSLQTAIASHSIDSQFEEKLLRQIETQLGCLEEHCTKYKERYPELESILNLLTQAYCIQISTLQAEYLTMKAYCRSLFELEQQAIDALSEIQTQPSNFSDFYLQHKELWYKFKKEYNLQSDQWNEVYTRNLPTRLLQQGYKASVKHILQTFHDAFERRLLNLIQTKIEACFPKRSLNQTYQTILMRIKWAWMDPAAVPLQDAKEKDEISDVNVGNGAIAIKQTTQNASLRPWDLEFQQQLAEDHRDLYCWMDWHRQSGGRPPAADDWQKSLNDLESQWKIWQQCQTVLHASMPLLVTLTSSSELKHTSDESEALKSIEAPECISRDSIHGQLTATWLTFKEQILPQWNQETQTISQSLSVQLTLLDTEPVDKLRAYIQQFFTHYGRRFDQITQSYHDKYPALHTIIRIFADIHQRQYMTLQRDCEGIIQLLQVGKECAQKLTQRFTTLADRQAAMEDYYVTHATVCKSFYTTEQCVITVLTQAASETNAPPLLRNTRQILLDEFVKPKTQYLKIQLESPIWQFMVGVMVPPQSSYSPREAVLAWQKVIVRSRSWEFLAEAGGHPALILAKSHTNIQRQYNMLCRMYPWRNMLAPPWSSSQMSDWGHHEETKNKLKQSYKKWRQFQKMFERFYYETGDLIMLEHLPTASLKSFLHTKKTFPKTVHRYYAQCITELENKLLKKIERNFFSRNLINYHVEQVHTQLNVQYDLLKKGQVDLLHATLAAYRTFEEEFANILADYTKALRDSTTISKIDEACETACKKVELELSTAMKGTTVVEVQRGDDPKNEASIVKEDMVTQHVDDDKDKNTVSPHQLILKYAAENCLTYIRTQAQYYQQFLLNNEKVICSSAYLTHLLPETYVELKQWFHKLHMLCTGIGKWFDQDPGDKSEFERLIGLYHGLWKNVHPDKLTVPAERARKAYVTQRQQNKNMSTSILLAVIRTQVRQRFGEKIAEKISALQAFSKMELTQEDIEQCRQSLKHELWPHYASNGRSELMLSERLFADEIYQLLLSKQARTRLFSDITALSKEEKVANETISKLSQNTCARINREKARHERAEARNAELSNVNGSQAHSWTVSSLFRNQKSKQMLARFEAERQQDEQEAAKDELEEKADDEVLQRLRPQDQPSDQEQDVAIDYHPSLPKVRDLSSSNPTTLLFQSIFIHPAQSPTMEPTSPTDCSVVYSHPT